MYIFINNTKHNWVETEEQAQAEVDFLVKEFSNCPEKTIIEIRLSDDNKTHNVLIPMDFQV